MKNFKIDNKQKLFLEYIKESHGNQKRKYTGEPYWTHPYAVAEIVCNHITNPSIYIEVALGHDLIEDTSEDFNSLYSRLLGIGYNKNDSDIIARYIFQLTDQYTKESYPKYNRKIRKGYEAQRMSMLGPLVQTVKYADLIHNTESILKHDPGFAKVYLKEKEELLEKMRKGDIRLMLKAWKTLDDSIDELNSNN